MHTSFWPVFCMAARLLFALSLVHLHVSESHGLQVKKNYKNVNVFFCRQRTVVGWFFDRTENIAIINDNPTDIYTHLYTPCKLKKKRKTK